MYSIIGLVIFVMLYIVGTIFMYKDWRKDIRNACWTKKDFIKRYWIWPAFLLMIFGFLIYLWIKEGLAEFLRIEKKSKDTTDV